MVFGVHCSFVSSEVAAPELMNTRFLSRVSCVTASATDDALPSAMTSTFCVSIHLRAMFAPISALFWWSADKTSIFQPRARKPESSTANSAAATDPRPVESWYGPD